MDTETLSYCLKYLSVYNKHIWYCTQPHPNFLLQEPKGPNIFQHDNAAVHKAKTLKTLKTLFPSLQWKNSNGLQQDLTSEKLNILGLN